MVMAMIQGTPLRKKLVKDSPSEVIRCISECCHNVLKGNIHLSSAQKKNIVSKPRFDSRSRRPIFVCSVFLLFNDLHHSLHIVHTYICVFIAPFKPCKLCKVAYVQESSVPPTTSVTSKVISAI